jgi:isoleucyl-tRNA synthetase
MKAIAELVKGFKTEDIATIEKNAGWNGTIDGENIQLDLADFEILAQDIPGWLVSTEGDLTVALDVTISEELRAEGIARELINRVQNLRKESDFEVTDKIALTVECSPEIQKAIAENQAYVCNEVLATEISFNTLGDSAFIIDLVEEGDAKIELAKQ